MGKTDDFATVFTEMQVSENDMRLIGFATRKERDWFRLLTGVQGVGGKVGLAILSAIEPQDLALAIGSGDAAMVARARAAGMDDVLAHLEEAEGADAGMYDDEPEAPASMSADEREHAETFRRLREHAPATAAIDRGVISADGSVDFG